MKIYTYYQDINFLNQNKLLDLWKKGWERQGFEAIVLDLSHAQSHPYFEEFDKTMKDIFFQITGKQINKYGMTCWHRWLAYATQPEEKFYVSDYDVINYAFEIKEPIEQLHMMDGFCPCLASGTPEKFEFLCEFFAKTSLDRLDILKKQADHYHDQNFFIHNFHQKYNPNFNDLIEELDVKFSRDPLRISPGRIYLDKDKMSKTKAIHMSHSAIKYIKDNDPKYSGYNSDDLRVHLMEKLLLKSK